MVEISRTFWLDSRMTRINYLKKRKRIDRQYYESELRQLLETIMSKSRGKLRESAYFLQDNASVHTAQIAVDESANYAFEYLHNPPYSPDIAPSDFFQFSKLNSWYAQNVNMFASIPISNSVKQTETTTI